MDVAIDYKKLFDDIPVALMVEDLSRLKPIIDALHGRGVTDFRAYFDENPREVVVCYQAIEEEVVVNREYLNYYRASTYAELLEWINSGNALSEHTYTALKELFIALAEGKTRFSTETIDNAMNGDAIVAWVTWTIATGWEDSWGRVIVSAIPLSQTGSQTGSQTS